MTAAERTIEARFHLRYGDAFSLEIEEVLPGQGITAVFGPSGSGKTTLLRCVAGLLRPDEGHLRVNGELWQDDTVFLPSHRRPLGYVFQEASLFPHLTAAGNLRYAMKRAGVTDNDPLYRQATGIMALAALLDRYPSQLSGGERQRVAIARALLIRPRLLLLDEPLAALDAARKREVLPYLEELHATLDIPALYVSHALDEVASLADHALLLAEGRVVAQGPATAVFADLGTAADTNEPGVLLEGTVSERDTTFHLMRVALGADNTLWVRDGGEAIGSSVRLRVLARDVSLALARHDDTSILNRMPATIVSLDDDADAAMVLAQLDTGGIALLARLTRRSAAHLSLAPGAQVWAQVKSAALVR